MQEVDDTGLSRTVLLSRGDYERHWSINESKKFVNSLIEKCRRLVGPFTHSETLAASLKQKKKSLSMDVRPKLVQDLTTCWSSTYDMLDSIVSNKEPLKAMSTDEDHVNPALRLNMLSDKQFDTIEDLCTLLRPVKELAEYMSGRRHVTCSLLYPAVFSLIHYFIDAATLKTANINSLRSVLKRSFVERFHYVLNDSTGFFLKTVAFLDFNTKNFDFVKDRALREQIQKQVRANLLRNLTKSKHEDEPSGSSRSRTQQERAYSSIKSFLDKPTEKKQLSSLEKEIDSYCSLDASAFLEADSSQYNATLFYKLNGGRFPLLVSLARTVFCVTATCASAGSLFSSAGVVENEQANSLHPSTLDSISLIRNKF
jgi:hypothetical protein